MGVQGACHLSGDSHESSERGGGGGGGPSIPCRGDCVQDSYACSKHDVSSDLVCMVMLRGVLNQKSIYFKSLADSKEQFPLSIF